ncbi:MAG: methylenetetrahydrofolate reductase C-terminal domain-containing protein [Promethearchaeota archaeon]
MDLNQNGCTICSEGFKKETKGICPFVQCPKSMLNGPCSDMLNGKCRIGGYQNECIWVQIYYRFAEQNRKKDFSSYCPPLDWRHIYPRGAE